MASFTRLTRECRDFIGDDARDAEFAHGGGEKGSARHLVDVLEAVMRLASVSAADSW